MTDVLRWLQLTDPETGLPVIVRVDLIIAVYPMQRVDHPPSIVVLDGPEAGLVVVENPGEVLELLKKAVAP